MQSTTFNLIDIISVLQNKWKSIVAFVIASLVIACAILFWIPKQYQSQAILVPGNPVLADKSRLFGTNIQSLYSILGNSDDVETIAGIISLDTLLYRVVDDCKLVEYYKIKGNSFAETRKATIKKLKKDLVIQKQEDRQLKIKMLTKNAELSAAIVNKAITIANEILQKIRKENYQKNIEGLQSTISLLSHQYQQLSDSVPPVSSAAQKETTENNKKQILEQLIQYQKIEKELQLTVEGMPPALYVIEKASPSVSPDKPNIIESLLAVFFASLVFSASIILMIERK